MAVNARTEPAAADRTSHAESPSAAAKPEPTSADISDSTAAADGQQEPQRSSPQCTAKAVPSGSEAAQWLLFNDFAISSAEQDDVLRLYGSHKAPVVLYFRQVRFFPSEC